MNPSTRIDQKRQKPPASVASDSGGSSLLLSEILESLLAAQDPDEIVRKVAPKVAAHVGADVFFNYMFNRLNGALDLEVWQGIPDDAVSSVRQIELGQWLCGTAAQSRRPLIVTDIQRSSEEKTALIRECGIQAYACYPLLAGDRLLGTLSFASFSRICFEEKELEFIASVVRCVAIALDRLHSERALRESSQFTRRVLDNLFAFVGVMSTDGTLIEANAAPLEAAGLKTVDVVGKKFWDCAWWNYSPAVQAQLQQACERALEGEVVRYDVAVRMAGDTRMKIDFQVASLRDSEGCITHIIPSAMDITARDQAEEALRASEKRYRTLFNSIDEGFCLLEVLVDENDKPVDYRYLEVNPAFEKHSGLVGVLGKRVHELVPNLDSIWFEIFGKVALTGEPIRFENYASELNRWFDVYAFRPDPSRRNVAVIFQNILERKRAEEALRNTEAQLAAIIDQSPVGICLIDAHLHIQRVNPAALPLFEGAEGVIGRDFSDLIRKFWPKDAAEKVLAQFQHTLKTGHPYFRSGLGQHLENNGARTYYDWEVHRIAFPDGRFGLACYLIDISSHVIAQMNLRESEKRLRFMAESMPVKIFTATPDGQFDYLNGAWLNFIGLNAAEARGWAWSQAIHPDDQAESLRRWKSALVDGIGFEMEHRFLRHDGTYVWHLSRAHAMRDAEGSIIMWIGSNTDIDHRKRAEGRLEETVEERTAELREAVAELEHFSYTITHDMRAPLRAMRGFGEILLEEAQDKLDSANQGYLRRIMVAATRMDNLIQDALNYSKIVRVQLVLSSVDPEGLLRDLIESYPAFQAPSAFIHIEGRLPRVVANEAGLAQCFSNLLNNAVKFVEPGTIPHVRIRSEIHREKVRLWFEDNGIGIAAEYQKQIFGMFQRLNKNYPGTGIGLALVTKAIERMSGRNGVESAIGKGSRFWLELKAAEQ